MKVLKRIFSTIVLAAIAFIIPSSQMFGANEAKQEEEVTDVVVFITINSKAPADELKILQEAVAGFTAGSTDSEGNVTLGELVEGSNPTQKAFRVGTYSPDAEYWIDDENGGTFSFPFRRKDIGEGVSFKWNNYKVLLEVEQGAGKNRRGNPYIMVTFLLNGIVNMERTTLL